MSKVVLGISVTDRVKEANQVQEVLTEFGCCIKTRVGLHEASETECSPSGLILLEIITQGDNCAQMEQRLRAIPGVNIQKMVF